MSHIRFDVSGLLSFFSSKISVSICGPYVGSSICPKSGDIFCLVIKLNLNSKKILKYKTVLIFTDLCSHGETKRPMRRQVVFERYQNYEYDRGFCITD
jgi:hypothetical protein